MSRTTRRRAVALSTLTVAALLGAAACSGGSAGGGNQADDKIVFSGWGEPSDVDQLSDFTDKFMEDNPEYTVSLQRTPYDDYHSKLLAQLTSNTAPDIFYIGDDRLGEFVQAGVLMPLNELMSSEASLTAPDDFDPGVLGAAEVDGVIYAAPNDVNPDALWYDKEALAAAGITEDPAELAANGEWTTAKFLEMNDKLHDAGLIGTMYWNYFTTHYSWILSQGGTTYNENNEFVGNTDPVSVEALQQMADYFQEGTFALADTMPEAAGADSVFVTHGAGFFAQGRYTIGTLEAAGVTDSYDIAPWPTPDGVAVGTGIASSFLAINADTTDPAAAFAFWTAYLSPAGQDFRLSGNGVAVPSIAGADDVVTAENVPPHAQTFLDMRDIGFTNPVAESTNAGLGPDINELMLQLYLGNSTAQEALDTVAALVTEAEAG